MIHFVVVEDDMDIAFYLMNTLGSLDDVEMIHISSPESAMTKETWNISETFQAWKLVGIIDLMLPEIDGVEVARWVRENIERHIPLIALTALTKDTELWKEAEEVFDVVLGKPTLPSRVLEVARELVNGS